jgi:predicted RND superfamily exporter protein
VPLIRSPPVTLSQLAESVPTLENPETDKALARKELRTSLLYRNLLISPDGTTTALKINVRSDETFSRLLHRRNELRNKRQHGVLSPEERAELARVSQRFSITNSEHQARLRKLIGEVRAIKGEYGGTATLHLAGVPLIIADSIGFIRHDLVTFGIGVLAFLIVILALAFRKPRWAALPLLTCLATGMIS